MKHLKSALLVSVVLAPAAAWAAPPASAYVDEVIQYDPAFSRGTIPRNNDARRALGKTRRDVSLGSGGLLELAFIDNVLTNTGDKRPDLLIREVGPDVESVLVAVMPADAQTADAIRHLCRDDHKPFGDGYCEIGRTEGGTARLDLDDFFRDFASGELRFNAVQLIDDDTQGEPRGRSVGADIDYVVALSSAPAITTAWGVAVTPVVAVPQKKVEAVKTPATHALPRR